MMLSKPWVAGAVAAGIAATWALTNEFATNLANDGKKLREDIEGWYQDDEYISLPASRKSYQLAVELEKLTTEVANIHSTLAVDFDADALNTLEAKVSRARSLINQLDMLFSSIETATADFAFISSFFWSETNDKLENVSYGLAQIEKSIDNMGAVATQVANEVTQDMEGEAPSEKKVLAPTVDNTVRIQGMQEYLSDNMGFAIDPTGTLEKNLEDPTWQAFREFADRFKSDLRVRNVTPKRLLEEGNDVILDELVKFLKGEWQNRVDG